MLIIGRSKVVRVGSGSDWTDGDLEAVIGEDEGRISSSKFRGGLEERRKSVSAMFLDNIAPIPAVCLGACLAQFTARL